MTEEEKDYYFLHDEFTDSFFVYNEEYNEHSWETSEVLNTGTLYEIVEGTREHFISMNPAYESMLTNDTTSNKEIVVKEPRYSVYSEVLEGYLCKMYQVDGNLFPTFVDKPIVTFESREDCESEIDNLKDKVTDSEVYNFHSKMTRDY